LYRNEPNAIDYAEILAQRELKMMPYRALIDENAIAIMVISNRDFTWMWPSCNSKYDRPEFWTTCVELVNPITDEDMGQAALRVLNLPQTFKRVTRDDSELKHARFIRDQCEVLDWIASLVSLHQYGSTSALFNQMKLLTLKRMFGELTMHPSEQLGLDLHCLNNIPSDQTVTIPDSSSQAAVGAAIQTALSRCTHAKVQDERQSTSFWKGYRETAKKLWGPMGHLSVPRRAATQA
jgi:hypothetical protein